MKLNHHGPQDYQSLLMHQAAVRMLESDLSLVDKLLSILADWDTRASIRSGPLRKKWVEIIQEKNWSLAVEESETGNELRQASPMACILPNSVRFEIIRQVGALKDLQNA
jgi:hypothetical protein